MSIAIIGNTTMFQPTKSDLAKRRTVSGSTDLIAENPGSNTVIIKYEAAVEEVQRELLGLGAYSGLVDGIYGDRTKLAIIAYQSANDLPQTGIVTPGLLEHIRYRRTITAASEYTATTTPKSTKPPSRLLRVESALFDLGYDPGDIDGRMTEATHVAIRKFETDNKLQVTGELTAQVLAELAKTTGYEDIASQ